MTAAPRKAGEEPELDRYGDFISLVRTGDSVKNLPTAELYRIRGLLEALLSAGGFAEPELEVLAELERTLHAGNNQA